MRDIVSTKDYNAKYVAKHFLEWRERQKLAEATRERVKAERAAKRDAIANGDIDIAETDLIDLMEDF